MHLFRGRHCKKNGCRIHRKRVAASVAETVSVLYVIQSYWKLSEATQKERYRYQPDFPV